MPAPNAPNSLARPLPGGLKRAIDYMHRHLGRKITTADLVMVSGIAERTLGKHFHAFIGLPPLRYLRQLRLAAVRESLLRSGTDASVTEVATRYGFTHLGRFSAQYRRSFGKSPSATLRQGRASISPDLSVRRVNDQPILGPQLRDTRHPEIDRLWRAPRQNADSSNLAIRALPFVFASGPTATLRALELLDRAMENDPDDGRPIGLAAWCHGQLVMYNASRAPGEDKKIAIRLAQRAAILDDHPITLAARCAVHTMVGEFDVAYSLVRRSLALDPSFGWAWSRSAWLNSYLGNSDRAIDHFHRAIALDPHSPKANSFAGIGSAYFGAGRYDAAAYWMRKAILEQPGTAWANRTLSVSYARLGERRKAMESIQSLRRYCPDLTVRRVIAAVPFRPDYLQRLGEGLSGLGLPD